MPSLVYSPSGFPSYFPLPIRIVVFSLFFSFSVSLLSVITLPFYVCFPFIVFISLSLSILCSFLHFISLFLSFFVFPSFLSLAYFFLSLLNSLSFRLPFLRPKFFPSHFLSFIVSSFLSLFYLNLSLLLSSFIMYSFSSLLFLFSPPFFIFSIPLHSVLTLRIKPCGLFELRINVWKFESSEPHKLKPAEFEALPAMAAKISVFLDITHWSPVTVNRRFEATFRVHLHLCLLLASLWSLTWFTLRPWRWTRHVPPKCLLAFNGPHCCTEHSEFKSILSDKLPIVPNCCEDRTHTTSYSPLW